MKAKKIIHPRNLDLTPRAKSLRREMTDVEKILWYHLRNRRLGGFKFRRQYPMGSYVVDFICVECKLIVELDGGQHAEQTIYDSKRTAWIEKQGYKVIRFWNNEVTRQKDAVLERIARELHEREDIACGKSPHPNPLPKRERG